MPLAPINPNNTLRYWVDYTTCGEQHSMQCRAGSDVTPADAGATIAALFNDLTSLFRLITIDSFRYANPGSNITVATAWPGASTYGSGVGAHYESAQYLDFVGRGPTGRRVRVAIFGCMFTTVGGDYRFSRSENAPVAAALDTLVSDSSIFLDVEYEIPVWNQYANSGVNAYWRNKIR